MKLIAAIFLILVGYAAIRLAEDYVRRSMNSFQKADRVWADLRQTADTLLRASVPDSVSRLILALMLAAGCGCFVRGMLKSHYLPRVSLGLGKKSTRTSKAFDKAFLDVGFLPPDLQADFSRLMALVILYDSYRNPLQGYLFRHLINSITKPDLDFGTRAEVELTAFSVLSRKRAPQLLPA